MKLSHLGQVAWNKGIPMSEETRIKCSEVMSGENHPNFGKSWSGMSGKKHSEETKEKMKESRKGEGNSFFGKKHSEETKKKISESRKTRYIIKQIIN